MHLCISDSIFKALTFGPKIPRAVFQIKGAVLFKINAHLPHVFS